MIKFDEKAFRLWFRPTGGLTGATIELWYVDPDLTECEELISFTPYKTTGYYYLDHEFRKIGKYLIEVRVNGDYHYSTTLVIDPHGPGIVKYSQ